VVIDLKKCVERPLHLERRIDVAPQFASYPEIERLDAVELVLDVAAAGPEKFLVQGTFRSDAEAICVRCLDSFPVVLEGRFLLTYLPESRRPTRRAVEDVDVAYYDHDQLEVIPLLVEQLNLSFPMRFLCSQGCRGLCPRCGANRNRDTCACPPVPGNSPFQGLGKHLN